MKFFVRFFQFVIKKGARTRKDFFGLFFIKKENKISFPNIYYSSTYYK